jgi:hypothetical protein
VLLRPLVLGGLLLAPPSSSTPSTEPPPVAIAATHGLANIRVRVRGRRDPIAHAKLLSLAERDPDADDAPAIEPPETDDEGRTRVSLPAGQHRFVVVANGFERLEVTITLEAGEEQTIELRLDESLDAGRYRTVVTTERSVAVSSTRLRDEEIREVPGSGGDPFAVVRSLPGASQVAGFLPYVVIRGAAPGNTGYYLDGVRVPLLFHVAAGPSVIHPYFIDEVDFYPSGVPVRLGRFASGIIEGRTRPAGRDRIRGEVDLRLTDTGLLLEVPFKRAKSDKPARGSIAVAGRYSYTGLVLSALPALNVKLRYWDYQVRLDHDLGKRARYTALVFGSYDEVGPARESVAEFGPEGYVTTRVDHDPDPFLRLEFHRINQVVRQRIGTRAKPGAGSIEYRLGLGLDRSGVAALRIDEWRVSPRIDARLPLSENLELGLGLDQDLQIFEIPGDGLDPLGNASDQLALFLSERVLSVTGLYVDFAWQKGWFEARPGVRADLWVQAGPSPYLPQARAIQVAFGIDPRLLLRERVAERWTLRQSLGVYHQAPDPPIPIPGVEAIGLDQGLQRNIQGTFGWEWRIADIASLTQDVYLGRLSNLQDYELSDFSEGLVEIDDYLIRVSGWSYGLETMLRLQPGQRAWGWLAYTLSRSTRNYPIGGSAPSAWDQRHILNLVLGWNISRKWRLGGRLHFNTGRPYTTQRRLDDGTIESFADAAREHRNDARLPPFLQFDVRFERIFTLRDFRLHLYLDLTNATLSREVLRCDSAIDNQDPSVPVVDGCVNPQALRYVLPSLGLRAVF